MTHLWRRSSTDRRFGAFPRHAREIARLTGLSAWRALQNYYHSDNLTYAASIAYYALLSLFPFSMLALAFLGSATSAEGDRGKVLEFVLTYFPRQFDFIALQLDSFREHTITLGVTGTIALVWGAHGFFGAITTAVNYAWGVEKNRSFFKHKAFSALMLIIAGLMLFVALLLVSASQVVEARWFASVVSHFPGLSMLRTWITHSATTVLFIAIVGFVYYFVPNATVRFRDVWVGAVVTGLLWKGVLELFSWYLRDMTLFTRINGSISAVVVFLLWVYVQAVILLYGVELTAAYARIRRGRPVDVPAAPSPRV